MVELHHHKRSLHTKGGGDLYISGLSFEKASLSSIHNTVVLAGHLIPVETGFGWISCEIDPTPPMFRTNLLELSRRSVDPWVEENIVTMLQLGAIKKIHRDFFFRVLILARMEEGKEYGKRFILDLKTIIQISHQKILKNQRTKVSS